MSLNIMEVIDKTMFERAALQGTLMGIASLLLIFTPFDLSTYISGQSAFGQNKDTTFSPPPPPAPFEQLSAQQIATSTNKTCTLTPSLTEVEGTPQQTEGPYFVDGIPNRSDIRSDTSDGTVQEGVPLRLIINVYDISDSDGSCTPLKGVQVDVWQANSQGIYSGVAQAGTGEKNFLRGYQVTDENGTVRFTTIYPGWYESRAIHIHDKVRTLEREWTSQLYLNNSINEQVHQQLPYSNHGPVELTNEEDMIFRGASTDGLVETNSGEHLMLNLTKDPYGYTGTFDILVNANQS